MESTDNRPLRELTSKQRSLLIGIGFCIWFSVMFLLLGVLVSAHEAIRVEAGKGDSWVVAFGLTGVLPGAIAVSLCSALRLWHEFNH